MHRKIEFYIEHPYIYTTSFNQYFTILAFACIYHPSIHLLIHYIFDKIENKFHTSVYFTKITLSDLNIFKSLQDRC